MLGGIYKFHKTTQKFLQFFCRNQKTILSKKTHKLRTTCSNVG